MSVSICSFIWFEILRANKERRISRSQGNNCIVSGSVCSLCNEWRGMSQPNSSSVTDTCNHLLTGGIAGKTPRGMCCMWLYSVPQYTAQADFNASLRQWSQYLKHCLWLPGYDCLLAGIIAQFLLCSAKVHLNLAQTIRVQEQSYCSQFGTFLGLFNRVTE